MTSNKTIFSEDLYDELKKKFKDSSVVKFSGVFKRMMRDLHPDDSDEYYKEIHEDLFSYVDDVKKICLTRKQPTSDFRAWMSVFQAYKALHSECDSSDTCSKLYEDTIADLHKKAPTKPSNEPKECPITFADVIQMRDEYDEKYKKGQSTPSDALKRLVLNLYTRIPPSRGEDYFNCKYQKEDGWNYVDYENKKIVIVGGKVHNSKRDIPLTDEMMEVLKETQEIMGSPWLIPMLRLRIRNLLMRDI